MVLVHSRGRANGFATTALIWLTWIVMVSGVLGYYGLQHARQWESALLGFIAASMVYVAVADLIPGLHRRPELRDTAFQALLIALGIGSIAAVRLLLAH